MWPRIGKTSGAPALRFHTRASWPDQISRCNQPTSNAASPGFFQSSQLTPEAEPPNFFAATARRLLEITRRNEIRREAKLPLLPIAKELRRMKKQEELEELERFEAVQGKAVWEEVLRYRREAEGNQNWRPTWMEGVHYQSEIYKILRQRFCAAGRGAGLNSGATDVTEIASRSQNNLMAT